MTKIPKVFLSHASEDKDRFVLDFARRLRDREIDVWLDHWEIGPGDSLVDKIFEEGLKEADAVIVVISAVSITKRWVREELNAATVKRINTGSKLIPVVIDDCEVPESLRSLVWEKIADTSNYLGELDRIVASIFGQRSRPPLGTAPAYVEAELPAIRGLSRTDTLVLRAIGDEVLKTGNWIQVGTEKLWGLVSELGLPRQEFEDSLLMLVERGWLKKGRTIAPFPAYFMPQVSGLEAYFRAFFPDYGNLKRQVAFLLINTSLRENTALAHEVGKTKVVITHILRALELEGFIRTSGAIGGKVWASGISPSLRRSLENG
jgi:hypothetical protein